MPNTITPQYVGRFAPSPSGPLHLGSLSCALASYLDAKANNGEWLLRIEDIDPPREVIGSSDSIIACLLAHHLVWDRDILYQSTRGHAYRQALDKLRDLGLSYFCQCTRQLLSASGGIYNGHCRTLGHAHGAVRLDLSKTSRTEYHFNDVIKGAQQQQLSHYGDCVIHRKDGLFAYQLAVVVDDIAQGITHVIRGDDLLETTGHQQLLFQLLGAPAPHYGHIAVLLDEQGRKLSKQNGAPALNNQQPHNNLTKALIALQLTPPARTTQIDSLLQWAIAQWAIKYRST